MTLTEKNAIFFLLLAVACIVCLAIYMYTVKPLLDGRRYIKMEIHRSYTDAERRHWERELKKLYISSIPLVGRLILKKLYKK